MTMARVQANLTTEEYDALCALALKEKRNPRYMAGHMIKQGLLDRGLLQEGMTSKDALEQSKQISFLGKYKPLESYHDAITYLGNLGYWTTAFSYDSGVGMFIVNCSQKPMTSQVLEQVHRFIGD